MRLDRKVISVDESLSPRIGTEQRQPTSVQAITWLALLVLLALRVPLTDVDSIVGRVFGPGPIPVWGQAAMALHAALYYAYIHFRLPIVGAVIVAHRRRLRDMNIDYCFLILFAWASIANWRSQPAALGWAIALLGISIPLLALWDHFALRQQVRANLALIIAIPLGFLALLFVLRESLDPKMLASAFHWLVLDNPPTAVVEEFTFRGLLWMVLKNLDWGDKRIVLAQAAIFWAAHSVYLFADPIAFWVVVPLLSVIMGMVVWKTKSIAVSGVAHICVNAAWSLLSYIGPQL